MIYFLLCYNEDPDIPPLLLHFDNASPHRSRATQAFLQENDLDILPAPAYSPDLAPSDFFLFGYLKGELKGKVFLNAESLKAEIDKLVNTTEKNKVII
jgi:transposase